MNPAVTTSNDSKKQTSATSDRGESDSKKTAAAAEEKVSETAVTAHETKDGKKSKTENSITKIDKTGSNDLGEWKCKDLEPDSDEDDDEDDDDEGYGGGDEGFDDGARYGTATARGWL